MKPAPFKWPLRWLCAFILIFATGVIAYALPGWGAQVALPLLPSGFAVAAAYRWGQRMWPAAFAAGIATDLWMHQPMITAVCVGGGLAGGAALTAWLLQRRGFDPSFSRARDVPLFMLAAAVGMTLGPTFGLLGYYLASPATHPVHAVDWIRWWSNTVAGVLLTAPALVAASRGSLTQIARHRRAGALWLLGVLLCCAALGLFTAQVSRPPILLLAVLLVVVGTVRFGLVPGAFASFALLSLQAFSLAFAHTGITVLQTLVSIWSFSAALVGLTLIITALLAERDSAGLERLRAEQRYAQIFDGSPQPIWVHDRKTQRFLMVNEAALRQYGWSRKEILSMNVAALLPPGESQVPFDGEEEFAPFETHHLTRDGRVLEVEIWSRPIDFIGQPAQLVFALDVTDRRAFGRALVEAVQGEQRRIGQEMHDGLGQELTGLALTARALANRAQRERDAIADDLDQLALLATSCIQDARTIVQGLSPLTDADGNLEAALETLAQRSSLSGTPVRLKVHNEAPLTADLKARNHLYRIAQEAVQNALKHSGARSIQIDFSSREGSVRLEISDDGRGLPAPDLRPGGLGMRTMRFRSSAIGGRLAIGQQPGGGNSVVCEAPQPHTRPPAFAAAVRT